MRKSLLTKVSLLIVSIFAAVAVSAPQPQAKSKLDEPSSNAIAASGCVTAGVEAGCLLVTDSKTGTVYNVYFRGSKKPKIGTAIRFTGTPHNGPTTCMQGQAVKVKSWFPLKMKCRPKTTESGGC